jgi:serine/threonine protein kinase
MKPGIEGFGSSPERGKNFDSETTALRRFFPHSEKEPFSDHYNLDEFSKRESVSDRNIAEKMLESMREIATDEKLGVWRNGKHSDYLVLRNGGRLLGVGTSDVGIRRLRSRSDFPDRESHLAAASAFENGIRNQDFAQYKGVRVPRLYFLLKERDENGEDRFYCAMEHIDGLTLGQICNPDGTIFDMDMQADEVERNIGSALERHPEIRRWPLSELVSRVERELSLCHRVSDGHPPLAHRDLHEDNIIFRSDTGEPVLIDFDDGKIGSVSDSGFAFRKETYVDDAGGLYMTDVPVVLDDGMGRKSFNALDNLKRYADAIIRVAGRE